MSPFLESNYAFFKKKEEEEEGCISVLHLVEAVEGCSMRVKL
jgi:peptide deformylase